MCGPSGKLADSTARADRPHVNLVPLERHATYSMAMRRAKELAVIFSQQTSVQRAQSEWLVHVAPSVRATLFESEADIVQNDDSAFDEEHRREVLQPLIEEMNSDQDAWARSDEDGWFYED